jgi:hypothetical protein
MDWWGIAGIALLLIVLGIVALSRAARYLSASEKWGAKERLPVQRSSKAPPRASVAPRVDGQRCSKTLHLGALTVLLSNEMPSRPDTGESSEKWSPTAPTGGSWGRRRAVGLCPTDRTRGTPRYSIGCGTAER